MLSVCSRIDVRKQPPEGVLQKVASPNKKRLRYYLYLESRKNFVTTRSHWPLILTSQQNEVQCGYFQRVFPSLKNDYGAKQL